MNKVIAAATYVVAHREVIVGWIVAFGVAYTPVATLLSRLIPRPPATSGRWARGLYDFFVDMPSWTAAIGQVGIFGGKASLPLVPSRSPSSNPPTMRVLAEDPSIDAPLTPAETPSARTKQ
jgi:hypothetical protein